MKLNVPLGATSYITQIFIQDSSSTTGAGLTGLVFNSSGLTAYYHRDTDTTATAITLVTMTVGTFTSSGFKEIDSTNMPGWYQFCPPNAALASGAKSCAFHLKGATNMAPLPIEVQLVAYNPDDATSLGLSRLDTAVSTRAAPGDAMALTSSERNSTADAFLNRDMSVGADSGSSTVRTVRQALRFLRNKWTIVTSTLTVYKEDDSTTSWTATVGTDPSAVPIISNDPAGP